MADLTPKPVSESLLRQHIERRETVTGEFLDKNLRYLSEENVNALVKERDTLRAELAALTEAKERAERERDSERALVERLREKLTRAEQEYNNASMAEGGLLQEVHDLKVLLESSQRGHRRDYGLMEIYRRLRKGALARWKKAEWENYKLKVEISELRNVIKNKL